MKRSVLFLSVLLIAFVAGQSARAAYLTFIPPTDPAGQVYTTNFNDAYSDGRGMVFLMTDDVAIDSVGIYHDLTNIDLYYELAETLTTTGQVTTGQTILRSGNRVVSTQGLEFIDFSFLPLTLESGKSYHFEFTFDGDGNQNFFHTQLDQYWNEVPFDLGAFTLIDGTQAGHTDNFVIPRMRVNTVGAVIPAPGAIVLGSIGAGLVTWLRRRRTL